MGGANGLIVAFVVAVWAAYFVPLVLRRYDEASTASSLESLSPLSRVVSRRRRAAEADDATEDEAEADVVDEAAEEPAPVEDEAPVRPALTRRAAVVAARRRRRTLLTLLTALAVVAGLAALSVVRPAWVAVPVSLVAAWLVACRVQVRSERGLSRPRARSFSMPSLPAMPSLPKRTPREKPAPVRTADDEETIVVSGQLEDVDPGRKHVMQQTPLTVDALDEQIQIAVPSVSTTGQALWDPLPVTLPTYVTKPRVGRTVRTIDFDAPGTWTSGHVEGEDVDLPGRSTASADEPAERQRRASGE